MNHGFTCLEEVKIEYIKKYGMVTGSACELSWFWNPEAQWLLPTRCSICKEVISAKIISEALDVDKEGYSMVGNVKVKCSNCSTCFCLWPKYARDDTRNLALIGHWDGWQPFSTSIKHSCGMYNINYMP